MSARMSWDRPVQQDFLAKMTQVEATSLFGQIRWPCGLGMLTMFHHLVGNVISCVSRVQLIKLNQVFQYLRLQYRPLLKHQMHQLRDIVQRNFRPACSTHLERSVAWKQLSGDVLVQEFRVLVVTGCEGMASGGQATEGGDFLKKKGLTSLVACTDSGNLYNLYIIIHQYIPQHSGSTESEAPKWSFLVPSSILPVNVFTWLLPSRHV